MPSPAANPLKVVVCSILLSSQPGLVRSFSYHVTTLAHSKLLGSSHPKISRNPYFRLQEDEGQSKRQRPLYASEGKNSQSKRFFSNREKLLASIIKSFLKGLTIPFPQLRDILQRQSSKKGLAIGLPIRECVAFLASYMTVGVLAFSFIFEKWSLVDSLYFSAVCFSTVGYGDLCPTTAAGRIFTCFFGVAGIAFLGAAVATICTSFVQAEVEAVKKVENATKREILHLFRDLPKKSVNKFRKSSKSKQKELLQEARKKARQERKEHRLKLVKAFSAVTWVAAVRTVLPSLATILGGGAVVAYLNGGWGVLESVYYSTITASTIGLGDFAPVTPQARLFAVFYIPLSVGAAGDLLSSVATGLIERRQKRVYQSQFEGKLTIEHLRAMDTNGDGRVTKDEYCYFMLKEMGLVSQKELDELFRQFDTLDANKSGKIDKEDLELMAKLRGAEVLD